MFGAGEKERENFDKGKAIDVLLNGLEKEGLTGPSKGKHMHRIMVLYEEFLGLFCEQPKPPTTTTMTTGDAARLEAAGERERRLRDLVRDSQELHRVLEEPRALQTRRQELARSEAERELRDVKEEVRGVREELLESREALQDAEDELEEARKKGRGTEKELEGVKKELMEIGDKARKDWEEIENQLEEIIRKLQHGFEEAEENGRKKAEVVQKEAKEAFEKAKKEFERTKGSLKAKAALASSLPLLALILALVWGYF